MSTNSVSTFIQSVRPMVNDIATSLCGSVLWMNRVVEDYTRSLPTNIAPIAQLALKVAPFVVAAAILPRKVTFVVLGIAAVIGVVSSQVLATAQT